ncbi:transposase [Planktothrix serta PCC 8927]|uniref:Transposase n=1 Tax=Planktothrix serta PCC 8927 TaxID=671068 RepID=A0A7Z9BPA3_9CYAN|nr:IS630 family transposase [Planktothrix serta]VXD17366.1 transposase [Planktothrix serta PCC 8927]
MMLLKEINLEMLNLLNRISRSSKFPQVRNRAQCITLIYQGFSPEQLMIIFRVSRKTLYNWLTRWEKSGFVGLYNEKGRGRKAKLNPAQIAQVKEWVKAEPKSLNKVVIKVYKEWEIEVSKETIKRIIKKLNMIWKRMKRGLSKTPDDWELEVKMPELLKLKEQDKKGEIDLRYLDESGFSLTPYIPYGWQEKNSTIILKSSQSKRINVLGLMNCRNELFSEIHLQTIDSETVINFLDKFSENLTKPTVVVLDQASIHTSDRFLSKLSEWEPKNLKLFWLPTYSPKQNLIEILWKFIKYEWIEVDAYANWSSLIKYLKKVLDNLGQEYVINFV